MGRANYLVFGDLHGRVLPAFRLAMAWGREHGVRIDGLVQVGDLGYFPDPTRLDRATLRHAADDPMELGVRLVTGSSPEADAVFHGEEEPPSALWFTAGNHEDFDALAGLARDADPGAGSFVVDSYHRVRCLRDGATEALPGGLRVGALWGIDDQAPNARRRTPRPGRIREESVLALAARSFDILLTYESPRDAVLAGSGSAGIGLVIEAARPRFAFFGHYGGRGGLVGGDFGGTEVYHLCGLELRLEGSCAESRSVGLLALEDGAGAFKYLDDAWLRGFTRHNWEHR
ncbi:metallophosphoesterase family protein [Tautonia plasticadhaerens]|uniref:Calcineurin-like phosphoesterase domain-containing protein n=1 Tax=Tautonia plasticadhaerens TaxID=2527974 RepID=A0A518H3Y9_9BACT|nr:hypothetical protein [Tautonia plasticadhaerens]QDV35574.1 hypothetical protein ElP_34780 [Tautonia plasticadhaerens]